MTGPPASELAAVDNDDVLATFFDDDFSRITGGYSYSYGGNTHIKIAQSSSNDGGKVLVIYFSDDYSGVNVSMGTSKLLDLTPYRQTGSVTFLIQGGPAAQKFMIGLMDVRADGKNVQTKVNGDGYVVVKEGSWTRCTIPLKAFADDGVYWDAAQSREISAKVDWSRINDFRISINRGENKVEPGKPVLFYLDQIQLSKTAKGVEGPSSAQASTRLSLEVSKFALPFRW